MIDDRKRDLGATGSMFSCEFERRKEEDESVGCDSNHFQLLPKNWPFICLGQLLLFITISFI